VLHIFAASFEFEPANFVSQKCQESIDIIINVTGQESNAADIEIHWDNPYVRVIDQDIFQNDTQIETHRAYSMYWGNITNNLERKILLAAGSLPDKSLTLTTREKFATVEFYFVGEGPQEVNFTIFFKGVGNTLDSNIANSLDGQDILDWVQNGSYRFDTHNKCIGYVPQTPRQPHRNVYLDDEYTTKIEATKAADKKESTNTLITKKEEDEIFQTGEQIDPSKRFKEQRFFPNNSNLFAIFDPDTEPLRMSWVYCTAVFFTIGIGIFAFFCFRKKQK
jgi:hypothetical protein